MLARDMRWPWKTKPVVAQDCPSVTDEHRVGSFIKERARSIRLIKRVVGEAQVYDMTEVSLTFTVTVDSVPYSVTLAPKELEPNR